jgi:signal transduction histidine kinase
MVHELRTPLAALKASTALLLRPDLPEPRRHDIVATMQAETDRLSRLTTDFLDLARLESGRTRLENSAYPIARLIEECVDIVRLQAAEREIRVTLDSDPLLVLFSDRNKIKQVLLNLLTNAIKYNRDKGSVTVRVTPIPQTDFREREKMARIEVIDTGYGISEEDKKHMFEKFHRSSNTADKAQGTGLGLVIARRIVEAHGGEMGFDSQLDAGTTFFLTLPMGDPLPATDTKPEAKSVNSSEAAPAAPPESNPEPPATAEPKSAPGAPEASSPASGPAATGA